MMGRNCRVGIRRFGFSVYRWRFSAIFIALIVGCGKNDTPDAFGNFEADEVMVSVLAGGQLKSFSPVEGQKIARGAIVGVVDTTQVALELDQIVAQRMAVGAKVNEATQLSAVYEAQLPIARRSYERTKRLFAQRAATAQQLDQAERDYRVVSAQIAAAHAARSSVAQEGVASDARVAQIRDKIKKSSVVNPIDGTVIATYAHLGEMIQPGQPLYKIANLDTLTFRAYVAESQLASLRLGAKVIVQADRGDGKLASSPGVVTWVASKAEFTPTPVQTRDERADLVYAVKVRVPNVRGEFKIGMPGDLAVARSK